MFANAKIATVNRNLFQLMKNEMDLLVEMELSLSPHISIL